MRRLVLLTIAVLALVPGTALAHHHRHHHRHHHGANKVRTFTPRTDNSNIGTVTSFDGSTLVITLNNGSTVSGAVTDATRIRCDSAGGTSSTASTRDEGNSNDQGDDDGNDQADTNDQGDDNGNDQADVNDQGDDNGQGDDNDSGDDNGLDNGSCSAADLQPGAVVHEARLDLTGTGPTFDKVELVK